MFLPSEGRKSNAICSKRTVYINTEYHLYYISCCGYSFVCCFEIWKPLYTTWLLASDLLTMVVCFYFCSIWANRIVISIVHVLCASTLWPKWGPSLVFCYCHLFSYIVSISPSIATLINVGELTLIYCICDSINEVSWETQDRLIRSFPQDSKSR